MNKPIWITLLIDSIIACHKSVNGLIHWLDNSLLFNYHVFDFRELREKVLPYIKDLVRQQRLAQLVDGQLFSNIRSRGKQKGV